jgi:hypothetical protein
MKVVQELLGQTMIEMTMNVPLQLSEGPQNPFPDGGVSCGPTTPPPVDSGSNDGATDP